MFTLVLAEHSKSSSLIDCISAGVDRMLRNFEPMRKQVEAWQGTELTDVSAKVTAAIRLRPPIWHLWMTFQCKSNSLARFRLWVVLSEGGFSRVGHLDPLRVRRGP